VKRSTKAALSAVVVVVLAIVAMVLWPAPDPLRSAQTVYVDTGAAQGDSGTAELEDGLGFVLNHRNLVLVSDRAQADAEIRVESLSVNLGDITVSIGQGDIYGKVRAVCVVTNLRSGRTHTMDLTVTVTNNRVSAELVGRKFWQFWK
jgi:hypothetical protein